MNNIDTLINSQTKPQIYVASLSDYNNGIHHGRWIDATIGFDFVMEEINAMLKESSQPNAEEWAIYDSENFGSFAPKEYDDIESVCENAEILIDSEYDIELLDSVKKCLYSYSTLYDCYEFIVDNYQGTFPSLEYYGKSLCHDLGYLDNIHDQLKDHINFKSFVNDMELNGDILTIEIRNDLHVFWNR